MKKQESFVAAIVFIACFEAALAQVPPDREGLLGGEGMGQAKSAEMNGYPGPKHILEMAAELKLTDSQKNSIQMIYDEMKLQAASLGRLIVNKEEQLDETFSKRSVDSNSVREISEQIGKLRGQLRAVHLVAHLKSKEVLTPEQIKAYKKSRGIGARHHDAKTGHNH